MATRPAIETQLLHSPHEASPIFLVRVMLDDLIQGNMTFDKVNWITDQVAQKVFDKIYPEMEQKILSDPQFKERVMTDVLLRIANKISRMKLPKSKKKKS